jgi:ribonuclease T1
LLDRSPTWPSWRLLGLAAVLATGLATGAQVQAKESASGTATVSLSALPSQAQSTHSKILAGGPFPYDKDGSVFGNREKRLPPKARGYYREYTVKTPGTRNRGARRLICGGTPPTQPDVCFYTDDHYASFRRVTTP